MRRVKSALSILLGLSESPASGPRWQVECLPESWTCSRCGGGLTIVRPPGRPMIHDCRGGKPSTHIHYVGLRAHAKRVWGTLWENRPRLVREAPRAGERAPSERVPPRGPSGMFPSRDGSR